MVKKIIQVTDPELRKKSRRVYKIDKKTAAVIEDMKDTLWAQDDPEGVGLAAPQIGKKLRIFLIRYKKLDQIFINPEIINTRRTQYAVHRSPDNPPLEGCLSLPHYYSPIERENYVKLKFTNEKGKIRTEEFRGFYAQIVLHEMDHLDGIIFVDRALEQKKGLYHFDGKEWEEVELAQS